MKEENIQCPFCDASPTMRTLQREREMTFEGVPTKVHNLYYSQCDNCGMQTITPQQTRNNKRTIIEAHKTALGLLTAAGILELRRQLGITQVEAAQIFGGGASAFSKYENSAITQTKAMDNVLRLALEVPGAAEYLASREGVTLIKNSEKPLRGAKSYSLLQNYAQFLSSKIKLERVITYDAGSVNTIESLSTRGVCSSTHYDDLRQSMSQISFRKVGKPSQGHVVMFNAQEIDLGIANIKPVGSSRRLHGRLQDHN